MMREQKAQASIETLLLIGGAIVLAASVGLYLKGISGQVSGRVAEETERIVTEGNS
jgi:uncharacterized protein (UPF0333 family)